MDIRLGRVPASRETPPTRKYARPLLLLPELFTTISHLSLLMGYLGSLGWEVFALDLYASPDAARASFAQLVELVREAVGAAGEGAIVIGHGFGGLIALKLAAMPGTGAAVAIAPLPPRWASPLYAGWRNRVAPLIGRPLAPPSGRRLFELVADADPFQREALIRNLRPAPAIAVLEAARGALNLRAPEVRRCLVVTGDSDIFAPHDRVVRLATQLGAEIATLKGRGHWLIGGRGLERVIAETQRFLIKQFGQELLLLYSDDRS